MSQYLYKYSKNLLAIVLITMCFINNSLSQDISPKLITENFSNATCKTILDQIQVNYQIRFFFKEDELPTHKIETTFLEQPIEEVLDRLLLDSSLGYFRYRNNGIVILPLEELETDYSGAYYMAIDKMSNEDDVKINAQEQLISIGDIANLDNFGSAIVRGIILDNETNEPIIGATVRWPNTQIFDATDIDGKFTTKIPSGTQEILVEYIGYQSLIKRYNIKGSGTIVLRLEKEAYGLDEVVITAQAANANVETVQLGVATISVQEIEKLPAFMGEADVVKSLLLVPGVSSIGEGSAGFTVRGGDVDQNLVMQDEAFIFNSSHAMGFFSAFNTDMVSKVDLYKGNIPSKYGGRLASVMHVKLRNGNKKRWRMKGGVGPISSRLGMDGPIGKKTTINSGIRLSHTDWVMKRINVPEIKKSSAVFYDTNLRINTRFNQKNNLTFSGYYSSDEFQYNNEFGFDYSTIIGSLSYNTTFSNDKLNKLNLVYSKYNSGQSLLGGVKGSEIRNTINYIKLKDEFSYTGNDGFMVDVGGSGILYFMQPGIQTALGDLSAVANRSLEDEKGLETAAFTNIEIPLGNALLISGGIRLSYYQYLGPKNVYQYENADAPTETEQVEIKQYKNGQVIASYFTPEPRLALRLKLSDKASIKSGYSRTSQYISQIFNSDSPTPSSQWQLSTQYIKPQKSHNFSIGYFRNFAENNWETSFEIYGRYMDHIYDYKDFAELLMNDHLETELLSGEGRSYGGELSIKRKEGKYNGWLSYTYSRTERLIEGINDDNYYPSNSDKTNVLSLVLNYQPNKRKTFTVNFNYGTGRPTTAPVGNFKTESELFIPIYTERNQLRIPDYHRIDIAYTFGETWKKEKRFKSSWTFSIYNLYSRRNAFSVFYDNTGARKAIANKLSIIGNAFPSITFNFEFI